MAKVELKQPIINEIKSQLEGAGSIVVVDYRGITVAQDTELRKQCREAGVVYKVYKNTMVKRALDDLGIEGADELLAGPTAIAFGYEDPVAPAKVISNFAKDIEVVEIKGGLLDSKPMTLDQIKYLSELPSKEVLIAKLMGSLNAPVTNFVGVLAAVPRSFVCALNEIKNKKEA